MFTPPEAAAAPRIAAAEGMGPLQVRGQAFLYHSPGNCLLVQPNGPCRGGQVQPSVGPMGCEVSPLAFPISQHCILACPVSATPTTGLLCDIPLP